MPNPPTSGSTRDIAAKALFRAVGLIVVVVLIHTLSNGWSTSYVLLTAAIGIPLIGIASFVADRFIQPAVQRRVANRR